MGTAVATIIRHPENSPAAPSPAILLPTMRAFEAGAAPQMSDPISNMRSPDKKTHFDE
jgi:hypothetical protein